jgi:hypothetical protein
LLFAFRQRNWLALNGDDLAMTVLRADLDPVCNELCRRLANDPYLSFALEPREVRALLSVRISAFVRIAAKGRKLFDGLLELGPVDDAAGVAAVFGRIILRMSLPPHRNGELFAIEPPGWLN